MGYVPTQQEVQDTFDYDPLTGVCTWKVDRRKASIGDPIDERYVYDRGYTIITLKGQAHLLHRLIFIWMTGSPPEDEVDHINGNKLDNRWDNLRNVTHAENMQTKARNPALRNPAPLDDIKKVFHDKWTASLTINGHRMYLGTFDSEQKALESYLQAKILFHGTSRYTERDESATMSP